MSTVAPVPIISNETPVVAKKVVRRRVTKAAPAVVETPVVVTEPVPVPVPVAPEPVLTEPIKQEIPIEIVSNEEPLDDTTVASTPGATRKRNVKIANKERLFEDFEKLYGVLEKILTEQNLKTVLKDLKGVRDITYRLLKLKTAERQKRDTHTSGFLKPVQISEELSNFLKKHDLYRDEISRAYLTTVLCSYIKTKQLQNQADKRIILPDADLKSLFDVQEGEQLTYYSIQKKIQRHISK